MNRFKTCRSSIIEHLEERQLLTTTGELTHIADSNEIRGIVALASGDVDGDGDLDIFLADGVAGWKENLGDGNFRFRSNIGTETDRADEVFPGDMDSDGDLDLVVIHRFVGERGWRTTIGWHENIDGMGGFSAKRHLTLVDSYVRRVDLVDIDNDRDVDVLHGAYHDRRLHNPVWIENNGGSFFDHGQLANRSAQFGYDIVDVDGDERVDLVVRDQEFGPLIWYRNTLNGLRFEKEIPLSDSVWTLFDYDGDGDADLATSSAIILNTGDGVFDGNEVPIGIYRPKSYEFVDADADGDFDLVYIGRPEFAGFDFDSGIVWNQDGQWQVDDPLANDISFSAIYGDFTGNSRLDLLYRSHNPRDGDHSIKLFEDFQHERSLTDDLLRWPQLMNLRDFDDDGDLDLFISSAGGGSLGHVSRDATAQLQWYENHGDMVFGPRQIIEQQDYYIEFVEQLSGDVGDLDGDGLIDVVTVYHGDMKIRLGYFESDHVDIQIDAGHWLRDVRITDVDRDGDLDILAFTSAGDRIFTFISDGSGRSFEVASQPLAPFPFCRAHRFKDVEGDGDFDIIAIGAVGVDWIENVDGEFEPCKRLENYSRDQLYSELVDLDGDGDLDRVDIRTGNVLVHETRLIGDVNDDGRFDSTDLTLAFSSGEYEDGIAHNSTFTEGDWNGDGEFDTSDIVAAFQAGNFIRIG